MFEHKSKPLVWDCGSEQTLAQMGRKYGSPQRSYLSEFTYSVTNKMAFSDFYPEEE